MFSFRAGGDNGSGENVPQAGVAGPYDASGKLADRSDVFSAFEPASSKTPREHLDSLVRLAEQADRKNGGTG